MASERLRDMGVEHVAFGSIHRVTPDHGSTRENKAIEIAINVATRRSDHRANDEAVALEADCVMGFSESLGHGTIGRILPSRAESYAREQKSGKRPLTLGDLCEMGVSGGREGKESARAALAPLNRALEPVTVPGRACQEALAEYIRESADVTRAFLRGATPAEILKELSEADFSGEAFKACLIEQERRARS